MIAYFDTSALIPLVIEEPGSLRAGRVWDLADHLTSVRLIYTEARAALAQAERMGRLSSADLADALDALEGLYGQLDLLEVDDLLVRRAGELAQHHALRGYDAIHLAAAERVHDDTTSWSQATVSCAPQLGHSAWPVVDTSADETNP